MTTEHNTNLAQQMHDTMVPAGVHVSSYGLVNADHPQKDLLHKHASALTEEISSIGSTLSKAANIGKTILPPAAVAAAAAMVGMDGISAGIAVGAVALGSISSSLTTPKDKQVVSRDADAFTR